MSRIPTATRNALPWVADYVDSRALAGGVAESWTAPAGIVAVAVKYTAGVLWMRKDATATVPAADISDGTAGELVLQGQEFQVAEGDALSFINATACQVCIVGRRANSR
jgi:hypothetical protein